MSDSSDILEKINSLKKEFYSENKKNILFKNQQKFDCANTIFQTMDLDVLFNSIIEVKENTFFFNYNIFKAIITPIVYMKFISFIFEMNEKTLKNYSTYDVIVDCKGLTMTGVERYKDFISLLSFQGQQNEKNFLQKLTRIMIIHPPFMVSNIGKILLPLMDKGVKDKIVIG
jgi:hypothetical protein